MPPPSKRKPARPGATTAPITDPRFAHIQTDPRFRLPSKKHARVALDDRFKRLLHDDDFRSKARVDRYGRKIDPARRGKELERFYRLEGEDDEDRERRRKGGKGEDGVGVEEEEAEEDSEVEVEDDAVVRRELRKAAGYDPAREGGFSTSESDSVDSSSELSDDDDGQLADADEDGLGTFGPDDADGDSGAVERDIPTGEATSRLAAVNMDWDNIRAVDLLAAARSFAPMAEKVLGVAIYPSDFGLERMEREELEGPPREIFRQGQRKTNKDDDTENADRAPTHGANGRKSKTKKDPTRSSPTSSQSDPDSDAENARVQSTLLQPATAADFHPAALRRYQLSRLRYFYAVLTCADIPTARALYAAMDGREYLASANFFDLRFVPDDTAFDASAARDTCAELRPGYRPAEFVTDALTRSRVRLTWDEDDRGWRDVQRRAFARGEEEDADLAAYVGGSDSDESEADAGADAAEERETNPLSLKEAKAAKLRAALGLAGAAPGKGGASGEMTVTWTTAGEGSGGTAAAGGAASRDENTREAYIRKERERKARRKERLKAKRTGEDGEVVDDADGDGGAMPASNASATSIKATDQAHEDEPPADPFDDPFFTAPPSAIRAEEKRAKKRAEQDRAEEAAKADRERLELLLDDAEERGRHFDMAAIERAEKQARRKGKGKDKDRKAKMVGREDEVVDGDEGFTVDVQDPRFEKLYTSHEFAIDPSNPRFKATEGMKALLEEGRRKRKGRERERDGDMEVDGAAWDGKKRKGEKNERAGEDDVAKLVARVKAREGRKK